jgi:hypothetical protein
MGLDLNIHHTDFYMSEKSIDENAYLSRIDIVLGKIVENIVSGIVYPYRILPTQIKSKRRPNYH